MLDNQVYVSGSGKHAMVFRAKANFKQPPPPICAMQTLNMERDAIIYTLTQDL